MKKEKIKIIKEIAAKGLNVFLDNIEKEYSKHNTFSDGDLQQVMGVSIDMLLDAVISSMSPKNRLRLENAIINTMIKNKSNVFTVKFSMKD